MKVKHKVLSERGGSVASFLTGRWQNMGGYEKDWWLRWQETDGWVDVWASLGEIRVPVRYGFAKIDIQWSGKYTFGCKSVIRKFKYNMTKLLYFSYCIFRLGRTSAVSCPGRFCEVRSAEQTGHGIQTGFDRQEVELEGPSLPPTRSDLGECQIC